MTFRVLFLLLATFLVTTGFGQSTLHPGLLDASSFNLRENRLNLSGTWLWSDGRLLQPDQRNNPDILPVEFPGIWNNRRDSKSGQGCATYFLTVILPPQSEELAFDLPDIYSSYTLFVNGLEVTNNGIPGTSRQTTVPQWMPHVFPVRSQTDTLHITLQVANFNHNKGGVKEPIWLGSSSGFAQKELISRAGKLTGIGLLVALAIAFVVIWFRNRKKVVIYFSLLCLSWAVRSLFSNDYLFIAFFPDFNWNVMIRIEYIMLYMTMIWAILFLCRLFKNEGSQVVKYLLVTFNAGFAVYTLLSEPVEFTRLLPLYLGTAGLLLVYGAGVVLVALINERRGATWLTMSVLLGLVIFSYDIFAYEGWFSYNTLVFSAAYLVIFIMTGFALLLHLDIIKGTRTTTTMLTYKDLYGESEK